MFLDSPLLKEDSQFDKHVFEMGWNRLLEVHSQPIAFHGNGSANRDVNKSGRNAKWYIWRCMKHSLNGYTSLPEPIQLLCVLK